MQTVVLAEGSYIYEACKAQPLPEEVAPISRARPSRRRPARKATAVPSTAGPISQLRCKPIDPVGGRTVEVCGVDQRREPCRRPWMDPTAPTHQIRLAGNHRHPDTCGRVFTHRI
jgi:hypothetical protein